MMERPRKADLVKKNDKTESLLAGFIVYAGVLFAWGLFIVMVGGR